MSDRAIIALATVPMLTGALLLVALQRVPAVHVSASAGKSAAHRQARSGTETTWLGVVVAGRTAELASQQDGTVKEVWLHAGERVKKGQPILQIDGSGALNDEALAGAELGQRRSEVSRAEARVEEASAQLARLEKGGSWIAEQELETARSAVRMARAELASARAGVGMGRARVAQQKLRARRHTLEAPFDGVLVSCDVDPGDSVGAGQIVARVITHDRQVRFALPREQLPREGSLEVVLSLPSGEQRARVLSLQPEVDPAAQLIFASATPTATREPLMPGTRVEVRPVAEPPQAALENR
jgi:membrane fusion protein, multidrug efflux system